MICLRLVYTDLGSNFEVVVYYLLIIMTSFDYRGEFSMINTLVFVVSYILYKIRSYEEAIG